ncbi:MAG: aspartate aminotransferase family protein [Deltaproteobacteria bacterium]|nr:aspartate aminotransferase family protein [Deltaproteobacteria bacterium]
MLKPAEPTPVTHLPECPRPREELLTALRSLSGGDADWRRGRVFSLVYDAGDAHLALLKQAHALYFCENGLNPMAFQSLKRMEAEVVRMAANLLHGGPDAVGTMTSGGTESLLMAVKAARDRARKHKPWIRRPELVMPDSAHVGFDKAAHYFGVKIRRACLGPDFRVDVRSMKRLINRNTVLLVGSAPQYPHGVVDAIEEIGALGLAKGIPVHVDACVGGFLLPFVEQLGRPVPRWDFRVPGVTSISADLHKYGYAAKGASVILYRSMDYLKHQFFVATDWPGGIYASPSMPGTRPGGPIAAAWAGLQALGVDGYRALTQSALHSADRLREGIARIDGLALLGLPHCTIVTWGAAAKSHGGAVDVYAVADQMEQRGWHVDRQQRPACVHLTVMAQHAAVVDDYLGDLAESVRVVRAHPELRSKGNAAMYGMMAKVPLRFMVGSAVRQVLEGMYAPGGGAPDLKKPPVGGVVGALLERHGEKVQRALDLVDDARRQVKDTVGRYL